MDIWRQCAEDYLAKMWFGQGEQDRQLVRTFATGSVTCEMLRDLCSPSKYGVARTVPGHGQEKYRRFAAMLNTYTDTVMTRDNVPDIIEKELAHMKQEYGRNFLSAITKAFWMMKQHPVVIYDSYACDGLRQGGYAPGYDNYRTYFNSWFRFFDNLDTQDRLDDAVSWLQESSRAIALVRDGKITAPELKRLAESPMFRNRIADMRLCCFFS